MADLNGKKSEGFDRIPVCCLFDACESLLNPMANLYEKIYDTGTIPEQWKFSKIIPTFKKGSKTENFMIVFLYENFSSNLDCNFSLSRICAYSLSLSLSLSLSPTHTLSLSLSPLLLARSSSATNPPPVKMQKSTFIIMHHYNHTQVIPG